MRRLSLLFLGCAAVSAGCLPNKYTVMVTPKGKVLHRELIVRKKAGQSEWFTAPPQTGNDSRDRKKPKQAEPPPTTQRATSGSADSDPEARKAEEALLKRELAGIAKAYGYWGVPSETDGTYTFKGTFSGQTPKDIGGFGTYTTMSCDLGVVCRYNERFRGNPDSSVQTQAITKAIDQLIEIAVDWIRFRLGNSPEAVRLENLFRGAVRHDAKNVALVCWAQQAASGGTIYGPMHEAGRAQEGLSITLDSVVPQYLVEHGYCSASGALKGVDRLDGNTITTLLCRKAGIVDRKGIERVQEALWGKKDHPAPDFLAWYAKTDHYVKAKARWRERLRRERQLRKNLAPPSAEAMLLATARPVVSALGSHGMLIGIEQKWMDMIVVQMPCPDCPVRTNGFWSNKEKCVMWVGVVHRYGEDDYAIEVPLVCFAEVALPNEALQKRLFGMTLLRGKDLAAYCRWYDSLAEARKLRWQEFMLSLSPKADPRPRLKQFRFAPGPGAGEDPVRGAKVLLEAMKSLGASPSSD